ncbi:AAA family ATPase [Hyphomicrobium sp.]|jgi:chromosome partitioning protein|uniref:AAA family ATPase n=1 Tax=Hyphomicrobium sp. TaxID=82 RepID=UPI0035686BE9
MNVVGFLNSKGGVGKSTLCAAVAVRAALDGKRVCIMDLDPQLSLSNWWRRRGENDNPGLEEQAERASDVMESLQREGWEWVFIDGPPGALPVTEDAVRASDLVVIPMRASVIDLDASEDAVRYCRTADVPYLVVFNQCKGGSGKDKLLTDARAGLIKAHVPLAETAVTLRTPFITAMASGKTGAERDAAASQEIDALWREIKAATLKAARARARKGA